jgi:hypothetical protein
MYFYFTTFLSVTLHDTSVSNALSSAMDLNFDTFFSDNIFPRDESYRHSVKK